VYAKPITKENDMTCEYTNKHFSDYTTADRAAFRRFAQGKSHAAQGRTDLVGQCPHYDAGHAAGGAA
tara:strand:+ start:50 stop:250 length:201 start_codon:yes stop_codon:yes gene_type:complete